MWLTLHLATGLLLPALAGLSFDDLLSPKL